MKKIFLCLLSFAMLSSITSCEKEATVEPSVNEENGYEFVDLGLSVKWATMNVGATKPEEFGNFYAWGETVPKTSYTKENYIYTDAPEVLPLSADAANVNWGGAWRMPTHEELEELLYKCTWTWCWDYAGKEGLFGYLVTSKVNGNAIFLPSTGSYGQEWYGSDMTEGYAEYMTSTLLPGVTSNYCTCMYFYYQDYDFNTTYDWYPGDVHRGRTIRPVISK